MSRTALAILSLVAFSLVAHAETPNIQPGLWEYRNTMSMEGMMNMPDQIDVSTECVTEEDISRGSTLIEAPQGCTLERMDMTAERMDYTMLCPGPMGGAVQMDGSMRFMGDRAEGEMSSEIDTPMGAMTMRVEMLGQRIGDC